MNWLLFLHWYQPHNQSSEILSRVVKQSYFPFIKLLKKYPSVKVNININGCLTEQLIIKYPAVLEELKGLLKRKQIEMLASAKHHAFLPLIIGSEINRQIKLGMDTNQRYFGKNLYHPKGFFPSELACSSRVSQAIKMFKLIYFLVDELSVANNFNRLDWSKFYLGDRHSGGLNVIPVNRYWSSQLRSNHELHIDDWFWFTKEQFNNLNSYLITANDMELFGHHYPERTKILERAFADQQIKFLTFSEYLLKSTSNNEITVKLSPATWETAEAEIKSEDASRQSPYSLWYDRDNQIQMWQWKLSWLAISNLARFPEPQNDPGWKWHSARDHLDQGLSSCYWWWSSCRPWWNPDMVCYGALHLIKSIRTTNANTRKKLIAEKLYNQIIGLIWQWHWSGKAQKKIDKFEKQAGHGLYWVRTQPIEW